MIILYFQSPRKNSPQIYHSLPSYQLPHSPLYYSPPHPKTALSTSFLQTILKNSKLFFFFPYRCRYLNENPIIQFQNLMEDFPLTDSFDNQVFVNLTLSKSIHLSLKPKLISAIEKNLLNQSSFRSIQKVESFPVIMSELLSSTNQTNVSVSRVKGKTPSKIDPRIMKAIDTIKETTVQKDNPINVKQLFEKAENVSNIKHQNKKAIKFIQVCEGDHCNLFVERKDWSYFSTFIGNGLLALPDGRKLKGTWMNGIAYGNMTVQYPNQSIYYGSVDSEMQKDGEGYIYFKNGEKLQAEFSKGMMVGRGKFYDRSGKVRDDFRFENGLLIGSGEA